ncbi:ATP-binding protein [Marinibaculum pumilum]|uniref:histidine kinase n=1 Tax=Marinibaculum pumilum TaxID=1766165 RepID=A0ABV7L0J0_9PROT
MSGRTAAEGPPSPDGARQDPDAQRWRIYVGNSLRAAPFQVVVGGLLVPIVWAQASPDAALLWFAAVLLAGLVRMVVCLAAIRRGRTAAPAVRRVAAALTGVSGLLWGVMPFAFDLQSGTVALTSASIIGATMVVGAAASSSLYRPAMFAFTLPTLAGQLAYYLHDPQPGHLWMAAVIAIFFLFVWVMTLQFGSEILRRLQSEAALQESHRHIAAQAEELRVLADRHRQEAQNALAASEAKSRFLANMSHEIRTPLNGVLGMAAALAQTSLSAAQRRMVRVIGEAGNGLLHIIDDVLDLSRIEAGKLALDARPFDLALLLRALEAGNADEARRKGLRLSVTCDASARGRFVADANRLRQVLQNLVANALKFTRSGEVTVRAWCDATGPEASDADAREDGSTILRFEVADTGIGIAPDKLEHIFQAFEQADPTTTRRFGGSGLGLSICRQLVTMMGGEIAVDSREGEGSRFTFWVPAQWAPDVARETGAAPAQPLRLVMPDPAADGAVRPVRILAGEDSHTNALVLQALLAPTGAELVVVEDGEKVLAAWEAGGFDLVLMDVHMPVLDGVDATRALRRREAERGAARTPVVALTANVMAHQVEDYYAAGMDACVGKPFERDVLQATIRSALAGESAATNGRPAGRGRPVGWTSAG